jgi:hypothetical protein
MVAPLRILTGPPAWSGLISSSSSSDMLHSSHLRDSSKAFVQSKIRRVWQSRDHTDCRCIVNEKAESRHNKNAHLTECFQCLGLQTDRGVPAS